jgi:carbon storage regulator CsrA
MLILTRRFAETIRIGDDVAVNTGEHQRRPSPRQAPKDVLVHSEEVFKRLDLKISATP